jgi:zinc protease
MYRVKSVPVALLFLVCFTATALSAVLERSLDNGLKVILEEDHSSRAVSVQVWYRAGSVTDTLTMSGRAAFVEQMMFRGTTSLPDRGFERTISSMGGYAGSSLYEDGVFFYEIVPATYLDRVLSMESDRMQNLTFETHHFEQVRAERVAAIVELARSPVTGVISRIAQEAFGWQGYGLPVSGHPVDMVSMTRENLVAFYRTYYVPSNATLILVGDFDAEEALELVEESFGSIPGGSVPQRPVSSEITASPQRRVSVEKPQVFPLVMIGFISPPGASQESYALEVLAHVFLKRGNPLVAEYLTGSGRPAITAGGDYSPRRNPTLFYFFGMLKTGSTFEELEQAMWDGLASLREDGISQEDIDIAKQRILALYYMDQEDIVNRGIKLGEGELISSWKRRDGYEQNIRGVTLSDVREVMTRYISPDNGIAGWLIQGGEPDEGSGEETEG